MQRQQPTARIAPPTPCFHIYSVSIYAFNDRYLLEVNGRYDGTSRYKADKRWGFFPSVSAGWRISEESFLKETQTVLNNLKLRALRMVSLATSLQTATSLCLVVTADRLMATT